LTPGILGTGIGVMNLLCPERENAWQKNLRVAWMTDILEK
jgi:hypothetical protein